MTRFQSNEEFFAVLRQQIERWCDQRRLRELAVLLPGYTSFFALTDDWARLCEALKATRAIGREKFAAAEWELLNDLISAAERAVYRR
jgi:Ser/Thr protein kinase RdoA (MazF antagonist)